MPLVLPKEKQQKWLDLDSNEAEIKEMMIPYDPDDIVNPDYSVSARIEDSTGKPLFISDTNIPVVTRDNPTENVEIVVVPVGD